MDMLAFNLARKGAPKGAGQDMLAYHVGKKKSGTPYTDNSVAYAKTVPANAKPEAEINSIGGKSVLWNQLSKNKGYVSDGKTSTTFADGVYSCVFNDVSGTVYKLGGDGLPNAAIQFISGHKYYRTFEIKANDSNFGLTNIRISETGGIFSPSSLDVTTSWQKYRGIATAAKDTEKNSNAFMFRNAVVGESFNLRIGCIVDLSQMFGVGSEPNSLTDERILAIDAYLAVHPEYNTGEIISADVTAVESRKADTTLLDTLPIHAAIQALDGYGQSEIGGNGNTLDLAARKFTKIGHYVYGVWTALETPVETDISAYLSDNSITVEAGGTLTFTQEDTELPVPSEVTYKLVSA